MQILPKTLILGGNKYPWEAAKYPRGNEFITGIESLVFAFKGNYHCNINAKMSDIEGYDLVIANSNFGKGLKNLVSLAENRNSNQKWITLIEGCASDYISSNPDFQKLIDLSDLVNCINIHSTQFFQKLTKTPVVYIGLPYPVESISKHKLPIEKRIKQIMICPLLGKRSNDYIVAKNIGINYYGYEKILPRKFKNIKYFLKNKTLNKNIIIENTKKRFNDPKLEIRTELPIEIFFRENANSYIWINLDPRYTWGRFVLDAAALGIPIITTVSTGHAEKLFPDTCLQNEFQIDKAIEIGKKLVNDTGFYKNVSEIAFEKMDFYTERSNLQRHFEALNW